MPLLKIVDKEVDVPESVLKELLLIAKEVSSGRLAVMEEKVLDGCTIDVGGQGIPYGTIRIRRNQKIYIFSRSDIDKLAAQMMETQPGATALKNEPLQNEAVKNSPNAEVYVLSSTELQKKRALREEVQPTSQSEKILNELIELISSNHEFVDESELAAFKRWLGQNAKSDKRKIVELSIVQALKSKTILPLLRTRLMQYVCQYATPKVIEAAGVAAKDPLIKKYLKDPRIRSAIQGLISGLKEDKLENMKCLNCENTLEAGADFCDQCGARIRSK